MHRYFRSHPAALVIGTAMLASGCGSQSGAGDDAVGVSQARLAQLVHLGNISQRGMNVNFDDVVGPVGLDLSKTVGLAACNAHTLYAVQNDGGSPARFSLYFSHDSGFTWTKSQIAAKGPEIACDRSALYTMDANKAIFTAQSSSTPGTPPTHGLVKNSGDFDSWRADVTSPLVDHIQGGNGTIYGVKLGASGSRTLFTSSVWGGISWGSGVATIGANFVTGSGAAATPDVVAVPRRAFTVEQNGTVAMNDAILAGQNLWLSLDTGGERYTVLAAATSNILYGLQTKADGPHLNRVTMTETSCADGIDNDGDGLIDAEDLACTGIVAANWCAPATRPDGSYCFDRFTPVLGVAPNTRQFDAAMVTCTNHAAKLSSGVCVRNSNAAITNADSMKTSAALVVADPPNIGHWCSMLWPSGGWAFSFTGADPCGDLLKSSPGGKIVRAGLWSTNANNRVLANCPGIAPLAGENVGSSALQGVFAAVPQGAKGCIFTAAPRDLPLLQAPFPLAASSGPSGFNHIINGTPVNMANFGHGQTGLSSTIDTQGYTSSLQPPITRSLFEAAYDYNMQEGTPLYAQNFGTVLPGGSRERDVHQNGGIGTAFQGELFIQYDIGTDPRYRETFVVVYNHLRRSLVQAGQSVRPGMIVAYVGTTGSSTAPHLDMSAFRLSNTNAQSATQPELGYHVNFQLVPEWNINSAGTNTSGLNGMDVYGWSAPTGSDPWAVGALTASAPNANPSFFGLGCWNINLWQAMQRPTYP